jgi:heat shock protein HslJ
MTSPLATSSDRRRRLVGWCLVPLAAVVFAGCGDDDPEAIPQSGERETTTTEATTTTVATTTTAADGAAAGDAPTGTWAIESLTTGTDTTEAPPDATLTFAEGTVDVTTGCNTGTGSAEVGEGTIVLGAVGLTMMACEEEVMAWEAELVPLLEGELTYQVSGDELILARDDTQLALAPAD